MTRSETAAFNAGVEAVRQIAMAAAVTIEIREGALEVRQRAAAAALQGLAEGAKALVIEPPALTEHCSSVVEAMASANARKM